MPGGPLITAMGRLRINDGEGKLPADLMRLQFEALVRQAEKLKRNFPLGIMFLNGQFSHYMDADTDALWLGYALGMRGAYKAYAAGTVEEEGVEKHDWWVFSTALMQGWLMLRCAFTGKTGSVRDPSKQEWGLAYWSPSFPFRWHDNERVVVDE